jgi:hypothetical protein
MVLCIQAQSPFKKGKQMFIKKGQLPPSNFFFYRPLGPEKKYFGLYTAILLSCIVGGTHYFFGREGSSVVVYLFFALLLIHLYQKIRWEYLFADWEEVRQLELPLP